LQALLGYAFSYGQSFNVNITNGYGDGVFTVGDTVHIWANEMTATQSFTFWTGDSIFLETPEEWHTTFIMPAQNVNLSTNYAAVPAVILENIQCVDTIHEVYYYFPPTPVGLVFLFHGTGGEALNWVDAPENFQMFRDLIANNFAVVALTSEEITRNIDIDGDLELHWIKDSLSVSNNVDLGNIAALIDTFETRGYVSTSIDKYAIGMSNGAVFAGTASYGLNFTAATPYCAGGVPEVYLNTNTHTQWCMAKYDNHPNVGPGGYTNAVGFSNLLISNGKCSSTFLKDRTPVYPEIFMRVPSVTLSQSQAIYNELQSSGFFDVINGYNYMNLYSDSIFTLAFLYPATYPILNTLLGFPNIKRGVSDQMDVCHSGHNFFSDHNKRTIAFLLNPCAFSTGINEPALSNLSFAVYPNPASTSLIIEINSPLKNHTLLLLNTYGQRILQKETTDSATLLDVSELSSGLYFLIVDNETKKIVIN